MNMGLNYNNYNNTCIHMHCKHSSTNIYKSMPKIAPLENVYTIVLVVNSVHTQLLGNRYMIRLFPVIHLFKVISMRKVRL